MGKSPGRPHKYRTAAELDRKVEEYFDLCDNHVLEKITIKKGNEIKELIPDPKIYTLPGLAEYLGYLNKDSIFNLRDRDADGMFSGVIKKAINRIERQYIEQAIKSKYNPTFIMFLLKCHYGYNDRSSIMLTGPGGGPVLLAAVPSEPLSLAEYTKLIEDMPRSKQIEHKPVKEAA